MKILFLGDIVGRAGRNAVIDKLPALIKTYGFDFVAANGENSAGGFGITEDIARDLFRAGIDAITLGNHAWDQKEALVFIDREPRLLRPINFPPGTPGKGAWLFNARSGGRVLMINAMGRIFMDPLDDPFALVDREVEACPLGLGCDAIIIDFHAEATSEKQAFGHHFDGRASVVVGTHTHTPTADCRVLPGGTAYMTDAGMCGDYDSVIGMEKSEPISRFLRRIPSGRFEPAGGAATLSGLAVHIDAATGLAVRAAPLRLGGALAEAAPNF